VQTVTITKMQGDKMRGELTTIDMANLGRIRYVIRLTSCKWQTYRFIQPTSCEMVRWNKFL